jgi:hypothetical protein
MYKALAFIILVVIGCISADTRSFGVQSKHIERPISILKHENKGIDWCPQCINSFGDLIDVLLNIILQFGVVDTCGHLCDLVVDKTGSGILGFICDFGCDILGIEEFVKLIEKADLDPIYYCEEIKTCPSTKN